MGCLFLANCLAGRSKKEKKKKRERDFVFGVVSHIYAERTYKLEHAHLENISPRGEFVGSIETLELDHVSTIMHQIGSDHWCLEWRK